MSNSSSSSTVSPLTSIRFFAALSVVIAHYGTAIFKNADPFIFRFFHSGGSAVMFFFVLSGFIVSYVSWDRSYEEPANKKRYFVARFARIAPLYYVSLAIGFLNLLVKGFDGFSSGHVFIGVLAKIFFLHGFFPKHVYEPSWAIATWSLSVEAVFYVLLPFLWSRLRNKIESTYIQIVLLSLVLIALLGPTIQAVTATTIAKWTWYVNPISYLGFFGFGFACCAFAKLQPLSLIHI
jgi:peptidoglycan/LPS O-acetylase OafA/YrhL